MDRGGRVDRDDWGVPHVVAPSLSEVLWWQGHDAAVDRRWQLTWSRLRAAGATAAVVGRRGLAWDAFARRCDVEAVGRRAFDALEPATRELLTAYVDGVREGLAEPAACAELDQLRGTATPALPWQPWTPLALFHAHHLLFATFPRKLWDEHVRRSVGPDLARVFRHEGPDLDELTGGSNAWAVGGDLTASGRPLVAGDPHRSFESPNGYQQVRLTCTDPDDAFDVAGFTFPGVPGVQHFAHAGEVAWGITNAVGDYQDLYVERLRRSGDGVEALGPDGWYDVPAHVERVGVLDEHGTLVEEEVEVVRTANGPVVHGGPDSTESDPPIALRHSTHVLGRLGFDALPRLLRARSAADVEAAFADWVEPVNNLVVADAAGDVRFRVVGAVPRRHADNRHRPVPGWLAEHAWTGWEDDLPAHPVAPGEVVVTANDRKSPDYDRVGPQFGTPVRAERIRSLLAGRRDLTVADMAAVHGDVLAGQPAPLHRALRDLDGLDGPAERLRAEVAAWDQHFHADSTAATAYVRIRSALVDRLADEPALAPLRNHPWGPLVAAWCDLPTELYLSLPGVLSPGGRRLLGAAGTDVDAVLRAAVAEVAEKPPGRWGEHHVFAPTHALGHRLPPPYDAVGLAGDNDCVRCTGSPPGVDLALRGSVARYAWDLAGLDRSGWVVPLGAAGDPASPHHHDQLEAWAAGRLLPPG